MLSRWVTSSILPSGSQSHSRNFLMPQPQGLWPHSPSPPKESFPCLAVEHHERHRGRGRFPALLSDNFREQNTRAKRAAENLGAEPSGEHSTSQFSWSCGLGCSSNPLSRPSHINPLGAGGS